MSVPRARYEQLLQDFRADLRPQRDWAEGRGIFLIIGHFLVGIGAGAWLMSVLFDSRAGFAVGFVLAALGGLSHLLFLGRPRRFWRMITRVATSWISRGFVGLSLFLTGGVLYLPALLGESAPWGTASLLAQFGYACAFAGMLILIAYMGFVYTASKAIPFWNSPLHPLLYIGHALRGGAATLLAVAAFQSGVSAHATPLLWTWIGVTLAVALLFALEIHGAMTSGNRAAERSVQDMLGGRLALQFYAGTLLLGVAIPAWFAVTGLNTPLSVGALALIGVGSALGDFFLKYSTVKAGVHLPVWTRVAPHR